jgi:hypothetical protein
LEDEEAEIICQKTGSIWSADRVLWGREEEHGNAMDVGALKTGSLEG